MSNATNTSYPDAITTPEHNILFPVTAAITILGCLTNTVSLAYFLQLDKKGLPSKLFLILNMGDLVVCWSGVALRVVTVLCGPSFSPNSAYVVTLMWFKTADLETSVITLFISISRVLAITFPFLKAGTKPTLLSLAATLLVVATTYFLVPRFVFVLALIRTSDVVLGVCLLGVLLSNLACVVSVVRSRSTSRVRRKATVTVLLLSGVYLLLNLPKISLYFLAPSHPLLPLLHRVCSTTLTVLNSALNPLTHLLRNPRMRGFVRCVGEKIRLEARGLGSRREE